MDAQKSVNRSEKLAARITALQEKLDEIKDRERQQLKAAAGKELQRAAKRSGLLALVRAGKLTTDQLEAEFRLLTEKAKRPTQDASPQPVAEESPVITEAQQPEKKTWFGRG